MSIEYPWQWDITDLENLIGQPESLRLEFKDAKLLDLQIRGNDVNKIVTKLSKEVSAFANTEGGTLIIGIEEDRKSRPRVASKISGVDPDYWNPEKLQQSISSNISPPLPGIRVQPVYLDEERSSCVYIIHVPAGTTAYQAKDYIYYGRSEYESKALPDHEIRMRMFREKLPEAEVIIQKASVFEKEIDLESEIKTDTYTRNNYAMWIQPEEPKAAASKWKKKIKAYSFEVLLKNIGEMTIRSFRCEVEFKKSAFLEKHVSQKALVSRQFFCKDGWQMLRNDSFGMFTSEKSSERPKMQVNIYPDDTYDLGAFNFNLPSEAEVSEDDLILKWKLYLEDRSPCEGEIAIREALFKPTSQS